MLRIMFLRHRQETMYCFITDILPTGNMYIQNVVAHGNNRGSARWLL
jgi:hypothetical protein